MRTTVPSQGCARSTTRRREYDFIGCEQSADAVGDVLTRKRCTGDILNLLVQPQLLAGALRDELAAPVGVTNLAPVGFPVFENLSSLYRAILLQSQGEGNEFMLTHDFVRNEPPARRNAPDPNAAVA